MTPLILEEALTVLRRGGVIAYPTETSYALGGDPRKASVVKRIFDIKKRAPDKSLLVVASSLEQVKGVTQWNTQAETLAKKYWPGPLTLVLPARSDARFAKGVTHHHEIAIRHTSSRIAQDLVTAFGFPLIATSANHSGEAPCMSGEKACALFQQDNVFVVDEGELPPSLPSTIVRVPVLGACEILRQGCLMIGDGIETKTD